MKPAPFVYSDPLTPDEALELLAEHGDEAKLLAGGQSLMPLLNFRLAQPSRIIDINRIRSLSYVRKANGTLRLGALTRQATVELSPLVARSWPLLREGLGSVAHPQIRNRGTIGGSAAHADPAAELPVCFAALDARFHVRSKQGVRTLRWNEFFVTHLTTALEPHDLLVEVEVPGLPVGTGQAFVEFAPRHGDFALGGAAALVTVESGRIRQARLSLLAAADTPVRCRKAEALLVGASADAELVREAARVALIGIEPTGDPHADTAYRRTLLESLVRQALECALARAED